MFLYLWNRVPHISLNISDSIKKCSKRSSGSVTNEEIIEERIKYILAQAPFVNKKKNEKTNETE